MNIKWIINDGLKQIDCTSFPYAYRTMHTIVKKGVETGRKYADMARAMSIVGPVASGVKAKTYSYAEATEKARAMDLVSAEGQINSREFKKR